MTTEQIDFWLDLAPALAMLTVSALIVGALLGVGAVHILESRRKALEHRRFLAAQNALERERRAAEDIIHDHEMEGIVRFYNHLGDDTNALHPDVRERLYR